MTAVPQRPALAVLAVGLGLTGGLGLHRVLVGTTDRAWAATLTTVVRDARMSASGPVADLDVTLLTSEPTVEIVAARTSGRGIASSGRPVSLTPAPRAGSDGDQPPQLVRRRLTVPLACTGDPPPDAAQAQLTVALKTGSGARHEVSTTIPSTSSAQDDLCSQAVSALPLGWQHPATASAFTVDPTRPDTARLRVSGLPTGFDGVSTTVAQPLRVTALESDPRTGAMTVQLQASATCDDYLLPPPVSLSVSVTARNGDSTDHYVAVGAPLARWLVTQGLSHCTPEAPVPTAPTPSPLYRVAEVQPQDQAVRPTRTASAARRPSSAPATTMSAKKASQRNTPSGSVAYSTNALG